MGLHFAYKFCQNCVLKITRPVLTYMISHYPILSLTHHSIVSQIPPLGLGKQLWVKIETYNVVVVAIDCLDRSKTPWDEKRRLPGRFQDTLPF